MVGIYISIHSVALAVIHVVIYAVNEMTSSSARRQQLRQLDALLDAKTVSAAVVLGVAPIRTANNNKLGSSAIQSPQLYSASQSTDEPTLGPPRCRPLADKYESFAAGVSASDMYPLMSVTKFVLGMCVGALCDRGVIQLTADIGQWFPEYAGRTIDDLMRHRSGIDAKWTGGGGSADRLFQEARGRPVHPPGEFEYNNYGPVLVTMIIDRVYRPNDVVPAGSGSRAIHAELFRTLKINRYRWAHGRPIGAYGLHLRPLDLASIGEEFALSLCPSIAAPSEVRFVSREYALEAIRLGRLCEKFTRPTRDTSPSGSSVGATYVGHDGSNGQLLLIELMKLSSPAPLEAKLQRGTSREMGALESCQPRLIVAIGRTPQKGDYTRTTPEEFHVLMTNPSTAKRSRRAVDNDTLYNYLPVLYEHLSAPRSSTMNNN